MNVHGTNVVIQAFPSGAASAALTGDLNSVTVRFDKNNPEVTTFGKIAAQRISGIRDFTMDFAGIFNTGTGGVEAVLTTEVAGSTNLLLSFAPASVTGSPIYSGCMQISNLTITGPQNGPVAISFTAQHASGSMTRGTVA